MVPKVQYKMLMGVRLLAKDGQDLGLELRRGPKRHDLFIKAPLLLWTGLHESSTQILLGRAVGIRWVLGEPGECPRGCSHWVGIDPLDLSLIHI